MTAPRPNVLVSLLLAGIVIGMIWLASQLIINLREQQRTQLDLAEIDDVKYGLLNADIWVEHITSILDKKIQAFELGEGDRVAVRNSVNLMLDTLITEVDSYMRRQNLSGEGWWKSTSGKLKQSVQNIFIDIEDIKSAIPEYTDKILTELEKPEARGELKQFVESLLTDVSKSTFAAVNMERIDAIHAAYDCEERHFCQNVILARIQKSRTTTQRQVIALLALTVALFLVIRLEGPRPHSTRFVALTSAATVLMACGVLTPMIAVEARITELKFLVLKEPVVFADQVLYYQSKSVLDMVHILTSTGAWDMIIVGVLIMTFSVLFPLAKLGASLLYLYGSATVRGSALTKFFALKSGKWSMADVMVVAIFMAYIGFNGMIGSQLSGLADSNSVDILTTNGTSLELGFFLFLSFCMTGLLASSWMESAFGAQASTTETG